MFNYDFQKYPSLFEELLSLDSDLLIEAGEAHMNQQQQKIDFYLQEGFPISLGGKDSNFGQCLAVVTEHPEFRSELGNQLARKSSEIGLRAMAAVVYIEPEMHDETKYKVSLRSLGEEDTTVISGHFGGGGHRNASAFLLDVGIFESWKKMN